MSINLSRRFRAASGLSLRRRGRGDPRGTATLEFALCLPILVLIFLGTIDVCSMVFLHQSLDLAAYEGSRLASQPGATTTDVVNRCEEVIKSKGIKGASVTTSPAEIGAVPPGALVTVHVTATCNDVGVFFGHFYEGREIRSQFVCQREAFLPQAERTLRE